MIADFAIHDPHPPGYNTKLRIIRVLGKGATKGVVKATRELARRLKPASDKEESPVVASSTPGRHGAHPQSHKPGAHRPDEKRRGAYERGAGLCGGH